ncbi:MAG: adenine deaminase [Planctomycetes bacterium]|nr:adenine deaminase [Planctomycetota bacterium]
MELEQLIEVAAGRRPADLVLRGGNVVNVLSHEVYPADVAFAGDVIAGVGHYEAEEEVDVSGQYICPGFIDAHVHIESSMLSVPEFAKTVVVHGTTAVVADPHEIANVTGLEGIRYILSTSKYCPVQVYIMLSSCVPASHLESAGAELDAVDLLPLFSDPWVLGLAEVMNYVGVVAGDEDVLDKLKIARPGVIDGHAPGLSGRELSAYAAAGIGSDHECTTAAQAHERLRLGMHVMIREGSQARNLDALLPLVTAENADRFMFVTDDKDVTDLLNEGQIDCMVRRAIAAGLPPTRALRMASYNAARYFGMDKVGAIAPGFRASVAVLEDLETCRISRVYQGGRLVAVDGACVELPTPRKHPAVLRSTINIHWLEEEHFAVRTSGDGPAKVHMIGLIEDQINTLRTIEQLTVVDGRVQCDPSRDLLKLAVVERHHASGHIGLGFVHGFGFTEGAVGSSVAHDAHNLVIVGTNDADIYAAAVHLVRMRGGLCVVRGGQVMADVPLPIAGLMSDVPAQELSAGLDALHRAAQEIGGTLRRPFMALSFLTLSVIGSLKLTDQGLIDVERFEAIDLLVT